MSSGATGRRWTVHTAVATLAMAASMWSPYAVSTLAPFLVGDLALSRAAVGGLVTATFAVAAAGSLVAGPVVDAVGANRGLLFLAAAVTLALLASAATSSYGWLVAAIAVAGIGQALANPATNVLLAGGVPPARRAVAIGVKQSGVQVASFLAGLALPVLAATLGWRPALRWSALLPLALLVAVWWLVPRDGPLPTAAGPWWRWTRPSPWLARLMAYSLLLGTALSATSTYLPLYAVQGLGMAAWLAGVVLAALGVSGLVARVFWARLADRLSDVTLALSWLSAAAVGCVALVWLAGPVWSGLVWIGAIGVGASAGAANAVSMLAVVRRGGATGRMSGLVSLGFFSGFVIGPTTFGVAADHLGYGVAWVAAGVVFAASGVLAAGSRTASAQPVEAR
ncbi:MFS transporter [Micromonospora sp. SL1-18]|uniref:MFS transporter n=1 Tax=Micromonospora sp. SL1-18 TaxID=3399128 RepID=UPI003A4E5E16